MPVMQVEGFPEKAKRSKKGSMHLRPRATIEMTDDELAHIKAEHKDIVKHMMVAEAKHAPKHAKKPPAAAAKKQDKESGKSSEKKASKSDK